MKKKLKYMAGIQLISLLLFLPAFNLRALSFDTESGKITGLDVIVHFPDKPYPLTAPELETFLNVDVQAYFDRVSRGQLDYDHILLEYTTLNDSTGYPSSFAVVLEIENWMDTNNYDLSPFSVHADDQTIRSVTYHTCQSGIGTTSYLNYAARMVSGRAMAGIVWMPAIYSTGPRIGNYVHEQGHQLFRFPDFYDYGRDASVLGRK